MPRRDHRAPPSYLSPTRIRALASPSCLIRTHICSAHQPHSNPRIAGTPFRTAARLCWTILVSPTRNHASQSPPQLSSPSHSSDCTRDTPPRRSPGCTEEATLAVAVHPGRVGTRQLTRQPHSKPRIKVTSLSNRGQHSVHCQPPLNNGASSHLPAQLCDFFRRCGGGAGLVDSRVSVTCQLERHHRARASGAAEFRWWPSPADAPAQTGTSPTWLSPAAVSSAGRRGNCSHPVAATKVRRTGGGRS